MRKLCAAITTLLWLATSLSSDALTAPTPALQCRKLAKLPKLVNSTLVSASWVHATHTVPAYCHVAGFVTTGNNVDGFNQVNFAVNLPEGWNGKLLFAGNGGFAGSIPVDLESPLGRGYAAAGTDTGHQASGAAASWAQDHPTRVVDFGYQGVHVSVVAAKEIVQLFFGAPARFSYFSGCSRGGGQAMMQSQRYPDDFSGLIAGAPAFYWSRFMTGFAWNQVAMYPDRNDFSAPTLPLAKLAYIESRVNANCDAVDGITDGIIDDPRVCTFDPDVHLAVCAAGHESDTDCLTPSELATLKAVYAGPSSTIDGRIWYGFPIGGEGGADNWSLWILSAEDLYGGYPNLHYDFAGEFFKYMAYPDHDDGTFDFHDFNFETDLATLAPIGAILDSPNADLSAYKNRGGKLIFWQGWNDAALTALGIIDYFERVGGQLGNAQRDDFVRLYMLPGVYHCGGGPGPSVFDPLAALEDWVERGVRPEALVAAHVNSQGRVDMTRKLCPYHRWADSSIRTEAPRTRRTSSARLPPPKTPAIARSPRLSTATADGEGDGDERDRGAGGGQRGRPRQAHRDAGRARDAGRDQRARPRDHAEGGPVPDLRGDHPGTERRALGSPTEVCGFEQQGHADAEEGGADEPGRRTRKPEGQRILDEREYRAGDHQWRPQQEAERAQGQRHGSDDQHGGHGRDQERVGHERAGEHGRQVTHRQRAARRRRAPTSPPSAA